MSDAKCNECGIAGGRQVNCHYAPRTVRIRDLEARLAGLREAVKTARDWAQQHNDGRSRDWLFGLLDGAYSATAPKEGERSETQEGGT